MSRPRNNLDELQRKHAPPSASSPSKPATPQPNGGKGKFKPAKSIPSSSTPSNVSMRKLQSFTTPGFNKVKPQPLQYPSVADNSVSYVNVSSAESTPLSASTSSIPVKRFSAGSSEDLVPPSPPKRSKTAHPPDKENIFFDESRKGKGRAREPPRATVHLAGPSRPQSATLHTHVNQPSTPSKPLTTTLRASFDALPLDIDLNQKNERELRAACDTAQDLIEAVDKLIGAARGDPSEPKDIEFLNILSDVLEKRQSASRVHLRAIQRGERPAGSRSGTEVGTSTHSTSTFVDSGWSSEPPRHAETSMTTTSHYEATSSTAPDAIDPDEDLWNSFADPIDLTEDDPPAVPTPATPPATQPKAAAPTRVPSLFRNSEPVAEPEHLTQKEYYPKVKKALNETFGLQSFRPKQLDAIAAAMEGRDVFVLFPTGSGKSLTFQIPAVIQDGVTVVVSPLKSLMSDQVDALQERGVDVAKVTGEDSANARDDVMQRLYSSRNKPRLLYMTPELLQKSNSFRRALEVLYNRGQLMRFVIDEAHCITDWGRRFRDSYTQLTELRKLYPNVPISALTATANAEVEQDIMARLGMRNPVHLKLSFNRKNLDYEVRPKKGNKGCLVEIAEYIKQNHVKETGIIYCLSRANCEDVAKVLRDTHGLQAKHYHASMDPRDRERVQREWYRGDVLIIVATIAFGMGIDKADVRYVIHYTIPSTLANYYQETGRAGRDGEPARCILYYTFGDAASRIDMVKKEDKPEEEKAWQIEDLLCVVRYCANNVRCRRQQVLAYFGEVFDPVNCQDLCDNCRDKTPTEHADHTRDALSALRLLENLIRGRHQLTKLQLVQALRGSRNKTMLERGYDRDPHYGLCKHLPLPIVERLVDEMLFQSILITKQVQTGDYNQTYLGVGASANRLKSGASKLEIELRIGTNRKDTGNAPASRQRKPRSRAAPDSESGSAGPSNASSSSHSRRAKAIAIPEEDVLSLYRDDPDDPDFDDIEEISSPPPVRRPGTRAIPSASQSLAIDVESDIEDFDSPVIPKVTLFNKEDVPELGDYADDVEMRCRSELFAFREEMRTSARMIADLISDEAIDTLSAVLPNDSQALRDALDMVHLNVELLGAWQKSILNICTKYHMQRR